MKRARKRRSPDPRNFKSPPCLNCGQPGPHFVPPSFGDRGFYICTKKETP